MRKKRDGERNKGGYRGLIDLSQMEKEKAVSILAISSSLFKFEQIEYLQGQQWWCEEIEYNIWPKDPFLHIQSETIN